MTKNDNNDNDIDEQQANAEIEEMLNASKGSVPPPPKHLMEGVTTGVGCILRGAVGACGTAILMPTIGAAYGTKELGPVGTVLGGVGGAVGGVVHAVNLMGGGIVAGVGQIVQGAVATPAAITNPLLNNSKNNKNSGSSGSSAAGGGKWWNANEGKWIRTNLLEEERWMKTQAPYDEDILGEEALPEELRGTPETEGEGEGETPKKKKVKDMYYYDLLGLDPSVDANMIKRRYFIVARKYSPDRCGANPKAQQEFNEIGHAYMILTNEALREKYDRVGKDGLWKDEEPEPDVDPMVLYTMLFGSDKFNPYIGRLAAATAVRVGDDKETKVTIQQARLLQKRRVVRLALSLSERLQKWAEDGLQTSAKADWTTEAEILCNASYGVELVQVIGKVYSLAAVQFLGSIESGIGMPSIRNWAKRQKESMKVQTKRISNSIQQTVTGSSDGGDKQHFTRQVVTAIEKSQGDSDLEDYAKETILKQSSEMQSTALKIMWNQTVVDITNTLHEVVQYVLHDQNVTSDVRKQRGEGLLELGTIFQSTAQTIMENMGGKDSATGVASPSIMMSAIQQAELEEIAFHAMLDTVWRQEANARYQVNKELYK